MAVLDAFGLDGKVAVVTGGNTGPGEAFARAFAQVGANVAIAARNRERSEEMASSISPNSGTETIAVDLDVTEPEGVERGRLLSTGRRPRCRAMSGWTPST